MTNKDWDYSSGWVPLTISQRWELSKPEAIGTVSVQLGDAAPATGPGSQFLHV